MRLRGTCKGKSDNHHCQGSVLGRDRGSLGFNAESKEESNSAVALNGQTAGSA